MKHNRPIKDFEWMNELDNAKGLNTGQNYNSRFAAVSFLDSIAQSARHETADIVKNAHFFSLTMDGTTDKAAIEQETLFIRTAIHGKVTTKFLCVWEPEATTSIALHELIKTKLTDTLISIYMGKIVGFGSDGASNMTGKRGGVITLMRRDYPWLIGVHCPQVGVQGSIWMWRISHILTWAYQKTMTPIPILSQTLSSNKARRKMKFYWKLYLKA